MALQARLGRITTVFWSLQAPAPEKVRFWRKNRKKLQFLGVFG
jgi:hypothetical protein